MRAPKLLRRAMAVMVLLAVFLFGVLAALDDGAEAKPRRRAKRAKAGTAPVACKVDGDCAIVTEGCCGCNEGGKQRAVLAKARPAYEKRRQGLCKQTMCPALMSEDPSCVAGSAICKDGACTLGL
jgi:hypothetical protein